MVGLPELGPVVPDDLPLAPVGRQLPARPSSGEENSVSVGRGSALLTGVVVIREQVVLVGRAKLDLALPEPLEDSPAALLLYQLVAGQQVIVPLRRNVSKLYRDLRSLGSIPISYWLRAKRIWL